MANRSRSVATARVPADQPYEQYRSLPQWRLIDKAVADLVKNGDIVELTPRHYIVGYLVKKSQVGTRSAGVKPSVTKRSAPKTAKPTRRP